MAKNIIIAGYRRQVIQVFSDQLQSLFGSDIDIKLVVTGTPVPEKFGKDSIVMVQSYDIFNEIRANIANEDNIIFIRTALQTAGLGPIGKLERGCPVIVAGDSMETALELLKALMESGANHFNMQPADLSDMEVFRDKTVITSGIPREEIPDARMVINIREPVLDTVTILDMGVRLEREDILVSKNIRKDFIEFQSPNKGTAWSLEHANSLNSSVKILLEVIDGTVISVDQTGLVRNCNDRIESIFGIKQGEALGKSGVTLFPEIPFREVINGKSPVIESLKKINGENMVVTVKPIFNSGKHYGAIAVIKRFHDEEVRQHKLRTLLMGKGYRAKYSFDDIIGESRAMTQCKNIAQRMAASNSSILITGETGTGKEMFAQAIHNASERKPYQFVALNCGAIPESLLESELFGYEEGAFTGARKGGKLGFFELAHKGTLFLDEISEMSTSLQKRLLRVLQEREVTRLGGSSVIHVDARVIAATNRDLRALTRTGAFREDLYYRLSVLPLKVPALRERTEDIRILAAAFRNELGKKFDLTEVAWRELERYSWPGNVRELRNYMEYFANLTHSVIGINELSQIVPLYASFTVDRPENISEQERPVNVVNPEQTDDQSIFVLRLLKEGLEKRQRLGRRSISLLAKDQGVFLGEQEIRRILKTLEKQGLVVINQTKAGTVITSRGMAFLSNRKS
jgi:transcriptional regulator with PAS, ATPase and Fis domain